MLTLLLMIILSALAIIFMLAVLFAIPIAAVKVFRAKKGICPKCENEIRFAANYGKCPKCRAKIYWHGDGTLRLREN